MPQLSNLWCWNEHAPVLTFQHLLFLCHRYMRVEANATHMVHQVLSSYDGSLLDEFTLTKPPGWRFQPRPAALGSKGASDGSSSGGGSLLGSAWARVYGSVGADGAPVAAVA